MDFETYLATQTFQHCRKGFNLMHDLHSFNKRELLARLFDGDWCKYFIYDSIVFLKELILLSKGKNWLVFTNLNNKQANACGIGDSFQYSYVFFKTCLKKKRFLSRNKFFYRTMGSRKLHWKHQTCSQKPVLCFYLVYITISMVRKRRGNLKTG